MEENTQMLSLAFYLKNSQNFIDLRGLYNKLSEQGPWWYIAWGKPLDCAYVKEHMERIAHVAAAGFFSH